MTDKMKEYMAAVVEGAAMFDEKTEKQKQRIETLLSQCRDLDDPEFTVDDLRIGYLIELVEILFQTIDDLQSQIKGNYGYRRWDGR